MIYEAKVMQQGLNDIVRKKVENMISGNQPNVIETMKRLEREGTLAEDFVTNIGAKAHSKSVRPEVLFDNQETLSMIMDNRFYSVHPHAITHLAAKLGVPSKYLRELATGNKDQRDLAATLLNEHSRWTERSRVLIRTVDGEVRGYLSDSYRRLNSVDILGAFITEAKKNGAVVADAHMTDTKVYAETILPQAISIPTLKNGTIMMYFGARFSTSDYGDGAVDMRAFLMNGVCLNGMVRESLMKQVHLGSRLPENLKLSDQTYLLDTKTTVSAVTDITRGLFNKETIKLKAAEIQKAAGKEVDFDKELTRLVKNNGLLKTESEGVQKLLMNNNIHDGMQGESTTWKLSQAITAHARELEPARRRELQELSGELLNNLD